jgi:hypothetical protein
VAPVLEIAAFIQDISLLRSEQVRVQLALHSALAQGRDVEVDQQSARKIRKLQVRDDLRNVDGMELVDRP